MIISNPIISFVCLFIQNKIFFIFSFEVYSNEHAQNLKGVAKPIDFRCYFTSIPILFAIMFDIFDQTQRESSNKDKNN